MKGRKIQSTNRVGDRQRKCRGRKNIEGGNQSEKRRRRRQGERAERKRDKGMSKKDGREGEQVRGGGIRGGDVQTVWCVLNACVAHRVG